jgi:GNAT superfamily N-acetyltransferase
MSIDIEILSGDAAWPTAAPLYQAVWPPEVVAALAWGNIVFAHADLRVLVGDETHDQILDQIPGPVCHVGIYWRQATWNGRAVRIGGIGGVMTHEAFRRRGLASVALNAAIQTLKDERATDFALLFCEPHHTAFYRARGWKPFTGEIFAEQPGGRIRFEVLMPLVFYLKRAPHEGVIDLCGLPW